MDGSGLSNGVYIIRDVIQEMESIGVYMDSRAELKTIDHVIIGFYALLIFTALKFAVNVSLWGWFLVCLNVWFFDVYAYTRKHARR